MLLDHIGVMTQSSLFRIVGRLAFPIYCFLLVEGVRHTGNPGKYALRLLLCALISELPFDLFCGQGWGKQNVMFTLLLGFCMLWAAGWVRNSSKKVLIAVVCAVATELLRLDYGAVGILMLAAFAWTDTVWLQAALLTAIGVLSGTWIQIFAVLAMVPILLYSGEKRTNSRAVQWGFYLFYPVHLAILYWISCV